MHGAQGYSILWRGRQQVNPENWMVSERRNLEWKVIQSALGAHQGHTLDGTWQYWTCTASTRGTKLLPDTLGAADYVQSSFVNVTLNFKRTVYTWLMTEVCVFRAIFKDWSCRAQSPKTAIQHQMAFIQDACSLFRLYVIEYSGATQSWISQSL